VKADIGFNEAIILSILNTSGESTIPDILDRIEKSKLDSPGRVSVYVALRRLSKRNMIKERQSLVIDNHKRKRVVGFYLIKSLGKESLDGYLDDARSLLTLSQLRRVKRT